MSKFQNLKRTGKVVTSVIAAAVIFMAATAPASAETLLDADPFDISADAIDASAEDYNLVKQITAADEKLTYPSEKLILAEDGMIEHYVDVADLDMNKITVIYEKPLLKSSGNGGVVWTVEPDTRYVTKEFKVKSGGWISAGAVVTPATYVYKLGIMDDIGHAWYINARGSAGHNFSISTSRHYRVFVQNDTTATLNAGVTYAYGDE